jgi:hypothetical protein
MGSSFVLDHSGLQGARLIGMNVSTGSLVRKSATSRAHRSGDHYHPITTANLDFTEPVALLLVAIRS